MRNKTSFDALKALKAEKDKKDTKSTEGIFSKDMKTNEAKNEI